MTEQTKSNDGFVRQRRNLMIISLVLLFSEVSNLRIERLSAFGTELSIGQPQTINTALWVAGFYWLLRYYQYSLAEYRGAVWKAIKLRVMRTFEPTAIKKLLDQDSYMKEALDGIPEADRKSTLMKYSDETTYLEADLKLEKFILGDRQQAGSFQDLGIRTIRLNWFALYWLRLKAIFYVVLHTTLFTEVLLPYLLFTAPVLYFCYAKIFL